MTSAVIFLHRAFLAIAATHTRPLGFPGCHCRGDALRDSSESPVSGLSTSTNLCCTKFRDQVDFDARAEWHLRHTNGTARMDAPLAEYLDQLAQMPPIRNRGEVPVKFGAPLTMTIKLYDSSERYQDRPQRL